MPKLIFDKNPNDIILAFLCRAILSLLFELKNWQSYAIYVAIKQTVKDKPNAINFYLLSYRIYTQLLYCIHYGSSSEFQKIWMKNLSTHFSMKKQLQIRRFTNCHQISYTSVYESYAKGNRWHNHGFYCCHKIFTEVLFSQ